MAQEETFAVPPGHVDALPCIGRGCGNASGDHAGVFMLVHAGIDIRDRKTTYLCRSCAEAEIRNEFDEAAGYDRIPAPP